MQKPLKAHLREADEVDHSEDDEDPERHNHGIPEAGALMVAHVFPLSP
jgi:hypothetical protein